MKQIKTNEELNDVIKGGGLHVIKVGAQWCAPCKMLEKTITEIEPTLEDVHFYEIDVDDVDERIIEKFGIQNVPVILFFNDGLQVDRVVGARGRKDLMELIEKNN